jgi:hypothetical protein
MVLLNEASHYFFISVKGVDCPNLIFTHEAAIAFDIGTEDGGKLSFYFLGVHEVSPKTP